jgi:hypothetical protein
MFREKTGNNKNQIPNLGAVRSSRAGGTIKIKGLRNIDDNPFFIGNAF